MTARSQKRAVKDYRNRLRTRGLVRFEVLGRGGDRELVRLLARRLAEDDADSVHLRALVKEQVTGDGDEEGGILRALRRSPLVGGGLDLVRPRTSGRRIKL